MLTDYHCHILPGIDDGAADEKVSAAMVQMMHEQGVERIVATPHFYSHRERSVERFLEKRKAAFESMVSQGLPIDDIRVGSEVAIEHGLSELKDIEKLRIEGTDLILLEFPYTKFADWMLEEIDNIASGYGLKPVIAHIHRYLRYYSKSELEMALGLDAIYQINNEAFESFSERRLVKKLIKEEYPLIFGSDSHNLDSRKPNWDVLKKKCDEGVIDEANEVLDEHLD